MAVKITKQMLGPVVTITWRDPREARMTTTDPEKILDIVSRVGVGSALATWEETGVIVAVHNGEVYLRQGKARHPNGGDEAPYEVQLSIFPESLVEKVVLYDPRPEVSSLERYDGKAT